PAPARPTPSKAKPTSPPTKAATKPGKPTKASEAPAPPAPPRDARGHVLSLSFLRDGDEFLARLETDAGQITEIKNRSLDQLLGLVANELEDLLE
ncbi:MAG: hypothetical protein L3K09_00930, partial [Thermoplasmata archaeon]|nr:hypothetical protein [Thermoplasmata archaeon]